MQQDFEDRTARLNANKKACNASAVFTGEQFVKQHYIESTMTNRGHFTNKCQYCNAIRYPQEKETICYQKGKAQLQPVPQPTPILKRLLER